MRKKIVKKFSIVVEEIGIITQIIYDRLDKAARYY